jgi:hypothetical protein
MTPTSPTPQPEGPELSALNGCSKRKVVTRSAPDGTLYDIPAKRQCTGNALKAAPNASSSSTTWRTVNAATSTQTAENPLGTSMTRISGDTDVSSDSKEEDSARLTTKWVNEVIQVDKDGNVLEHDGSIGPARSRKDRRLKDAIPAQATAPTGGKGKSKDTMPAWTGKNALKAAAVVESIESLSESDDDDKKEFSESHNPQNGEANNLMTYRMTQREVGKPHLFFLLSKPRC